MRSLNNTADIVCQDLSQNLILHGGVCLTPNGVSKLGLDHAERAFDVGTQMIPPQESLSMIMVGVEHLRPQSTFFMGGVAFEGDIRRCPYVGNRLQVTLRGISQVSRHLSDVEITGCTIEEGGE